LLGDSECSLDPQVRIASGVMENIKKI